MGPDASGPAPAPVPEAAPPRLGAAELAMAGMALLLFLTSQLLALALVRPFRASGIKGFEDPTDWKNGLWLLLMVVGLTAVILWIARKNLDRWIKGIMLASIGVTLAYVFYPFIDMLPTPVFDTVVLPLPYAPTPFNWAAIVAAVPAAVLAWLLLRYPEWYIVDAVGVGVSAGVIAIFGGAGFTPVTYLFVLIAFAVYDYLSVYRTKHMLTLADKVLDLHLPLLFIIPKTRDYSYLDEVGQARAAAAGTRKKPRDAVFIGWGDVILPSIFGVAGYAQPPGSLGAALGCFGGILIGLVVLLWLVLKGRPHAGLPILNAGAFLGFLAGLWLDTGSVRFW